MSLQAHLAGTAVKQLLGIEDQHTRQLTRIESKVQASLEGPYHAGQLHLEQAESSPDRHDEFLKLAEADFTLAVANFKAVDPLQSAWAALYLAGISKLQDRTADAARWIRAAYEFGVDGATIRCAEVNDQADGRVGKRLKITKVGGPAATGSLGAFLVGAGSVATGVAAAALWPLIPVGLAVGGGTAYYRAHRVSQVRNELGEIATFMDELADLREGIGDREVLRYEMLVDDVNHVAFIARK